MNAVHRALFFSAVERSGGLVLSVLSTAVLSRLLAPEEFGIYFAIAALTALAAACTQEFGGANYLIQKAGLSEQDIRTAFTITLCMSVALAAGFFSLRDAAASFYSQEGLKKGIAVFALNFLLAPFSLTISALLRREMAFGVLARCNLIAGVIAAAASVALTAAGWSFMGPVWGTLAGNAALIPLLVFHRRNVRIFRPCLEGCRAVFGFGAYSSAVAIINVFYGSAPQLILGRILGFAAVGLYGRAVGVTQLFDRLFIGVLGPVIMPAIFAQTRAGADLKRLYLQAIELITAMQWPFLTFIALMAEPIVRVWFGPGWIEVVPLVRLLCLASMALFAACLTYPVLVAVGRVRDTLVTSLISVPPSLLAIFVASFFGVRAVAAAALLTLPFQAVVAIYFISRHLDIGWAELMRATRKSAIVTACSCAGVMVSLAANDFSLTVPMLGFLGAGAAGSAGWCLGLAITRHPLLAQMRQAASGMMRAVPSPFSLRRTGAVRFHGKSI